MTRDENPMADQWLEWARKLQAVAQCGLTYTRNPFEIERYEQIREVAAEMMANASDLEVGQIQGLFAILKGNYSGQPTSAAGGWQVEQLHFAPSRLSSGTRRPPTQYLLRKPGEMGGGRFAPAPPPTPQTVEQIPYPHALKGYGADFTKDANRR